MRLPIESVRKTAGYLTLVPAYGRDYKSKREVMEAWDAGKDFIVQDMMSPYDGKPINKSDAKAGGVGNVNIRYKGMRSVAVIKVAKFPEGKKMTVDEVAEVVGPEFKEMNEDPPESVKKVREDMEESMSSDLLPVERAAASRSAGSYLDLFFDEKDIPYKVFDVKDSQGVTHSIPNEVVIEAIKGTRGGEQAKIEKMLRMIDFKNGDVNHYLAHLARGLAEQYSGNLRFASPQQAEKLEAEAEANEAQADADRQKADAARMKEGAGGLYGYTKGTQSDVESTIRKAQRQASKLAKTLHGQDSQAMDFLRVHAKRANSKTARLLLALMGEYPKVDLLPIEQVKQAENTPMGMYGYPSGTARLALDACSALRSGIGEVAYNLHSRRMAKHDRITGFLKDHSKAVKCGYTRLLLDTYPESPRLAAKKKIPDALKKHQFTKDDNPNPKGNDKDGDGKSGEKPDFLKEIEDKKGKKSAGRNPFPELGRSVFSGQAVQAVFPGPYDRRTKDVMGDTSPLGYWATMFGDENGWFRYSDIAILAGDDGESIDMVHREDGKWYWGASVDLEPWRTASLSKKSAGRNPFPELGRSVFSGQAVQAVFPGPYDRRTKDVMGDTSPLGYWATMFGDENGWFRYSDIAILAGDDGESIDMVHREDGKWYWGASVDLEPWRTASLSKKASLRRTARRHFAGRRYDYGEVIDFLTDDKSTPELERMWKKWSAMVEDLHERWIEGWAEANAPELLDESIDYAELAWKAFGSVTGMGIGLWEGDFLGDEHDEAFEKVVERDSKVSRFGQDLNDEITMVQEGEDEESMRMASDQMLRKAFVPDTVDGWLEWEGGTRTAASKKASRKVTIEAEDGGHIVYLHGHRRITGLTPPVPLRQAEEIASIVRNYPKNLTAEQIGSELHRSFFASRRA